MTFEIGALKRIFLENSLLNKYAIKKIDTKIKTISVNLQLFFSNVSTSVKKTKQKKTKTVYSIFCQSVL